MPKQIKRIEGGTSKPFSDLEPTQTFEKNLGFIANNTVTHLGGPMSYKKMQEKFVFLAPIVAADVKPWNDRNTNNADTKLSKERPFNNIRQLPRLPEESDKKKIRHTNSLVGQGYSGLGPVELNKRMKQHQEIAKKALKKGDQYDTDMKDAYKLIGQFGSDPAFPTDAMYRSADRDFVKRNKQYNIASKYKAGYNKLVGNLNY